MPPRTKRWSFPTTPGNKLLVALACLLAGHAPLADAAPETAERRLAAITVAPPRPAPVVGERLSFRGYWMGIPVGRGWIEVTEIVEYEGRRAYHIQAEGRSNDVLSTFYPIQDRVSSYLDVETLQPLRFEKHQREGRYRADEIVTFDPVKGMASYRSLLNGSTKEIPLPPHVQDLVSALYWFRSQPMQPNTTFHLDLYTDERIYQTEIQVKQPKLLELLKRGSFPCLVVEPKASFKGLMVKRGRIWAYLTADERRLPLLVKVTTPWGPMSAVIDEDSLRTALQSTP